VSRSAVLAAILVFTGQAVAETVMSWQDCVKKVAEGNADLAASVANVKVTQSQYSGSYANFMPQLSASAGYTDSSVTGTVPTPGSLTQVVSVQNQYTESLTANQSLFNGFSDVGKVRQANANLQAARAQLAMEKATLNQLLKNAFAQMLFQQKSVELNAAILKRQEDNLRMITLRYKGGNENKGNLLYQQGTLAQAKYQYEHSMRQLKNAVKQLAALWGEPNLRYLKVSGDLAWQVPDHEPDFERMAVNNPSHVNAIEQYRASDFNVQVVDGGWMPNVGLIGSLGRVGQTWPPQNERWSVGISLTFPFFPGTAQIFAAETARAQRLQAEFQEHSTDYKLIAGLENAYDALLDAAAQVQVNEVFREGAAARSRIANGKYGSGLMTFEDWSVIDADLVNREQNLLQSQLNAMQTQASWELAQGIGDIQ
jgi:outer membrane protein TolC